jgi:predicted dehydrogenase
MHIAAEPISRRRALALLVFTSPLAFGLASDNFPTAGRSTGMIRLAMLSFWHVHAQDYLQQAQKNPDAKIAAVWDESAERGRARAQALGVPFYERLNDLLAQANVDGVIVDTPTTLHRDVMVAAANAGKHIFTEKVLAPTLRESNEIVEAVKQANVKLMVSLPRLYSGSTLAVRQILERRLLGQLTQVRVRLTHDGALRTTQNPQGWLPPYFFDPLQTGGGAMIDLGSHPMYLTRLFLGLPESVNATYGYVTGRVVEDNAIAILHYTSGAIGIAETSFVNPVSPFTIEAHGTEGSLLYGTPEGILYIRSSQTGNAWQQWKDIPADSPGAFQQWIRHIQAGTTATENIQIALDLSALIEAANRSAALHQTVSLSSLPR